MSVKCVRVLVEGRVQGVWFRGWTVEQARRLELDGWVRNLRDGRVQAVFHGGEDDVDAMVDLCRQGPPMARVSGVSVVPEYTHPDRGFHQHPTGQADDP